LTISQRYLRQSLFDYKGRFFRKWDVSLFVPILKGVKRYLYLKDGGVFILSLPNIREFRTLWGIIH